MTAGQCDPAPVAGATRPCGRRRAHGRVARATGLVLAAISLGTGPGLGCAGRSDRAAVPATPDAPLPATGPAAAADPVYASVTHDDFGVLWRAAADAARDRFFKVDSTDPRVGVLRTEPMVSKQFFEVWRRDAVTFGDVAESSLATVRRTVAFAFARNADGTYTVAPEVQVERYASSERRVTSPALYRSAYRNNPYARGSREADRGLNLPRQYWYPTGRDLALERDLAESIEKKLK